MVMWRFTFFGLLMVALTACGGLSKKVDEREDPNQTLVFGYLDMQDAPAKFQYMTVKQVKPAINQPLFGARINDGAFYNEHFKPGSYQLYVFGGATSFWRRTFTNVGSIEFRFPVQGEGFRVKKPGLLFLGSMKYKHIDRGFFRTDQFDIEPIKSPTEREVLEKILPYTEGTQWNGVVKARIQELSR